MAYKKIDYDEISEITSKGALKCQDWMQQLADIDKSCKVLRESKAIDGQAANNIKAYVNEVHGTLNSLFNGVLQTYSARAASYYQGYISQVDSGGVANQKLSHVVIVNQEVNGTDGSIKKNIDAVKKLAESLTIEANNVKSNIAYLMTIYNSPNISFLNEKLDAALKKATDVNSKAESYESSRKNDFEQIDRILTEAENIINSLLSDTRVPVINYKNGNISSMCNVGQINKDMAEMQKIVDDFITSDDYENAMYLAYNRDALVQKEAEESREWIQWVAIGVAVVGSVAVIVVTAGGATPLVCAGVGALAGGTTAVASGFANNYVKTGSFTEGMDWGDFGKDVVVGTVTGAVSGYLGAVSQGSVIRQPIKNAAIAAGNTALKEGAGGVAGTLWDVGYAVVTNKPGDEIKSIILNDLEETGKNVVVNSSASFAGGYVAGKYGVDTSDKGYLRKLGEKTVENFFETGTESVVNTAWELGECVFDDDKDVVSVLKDNSSDFVNDFTKKTVKSAIKLSIPQTGDIDNKFVKVMAETTKDTIADTSSQIAGGVVSREVDYIYGDRNAEEILGNIWEEDLDGGKTIVKNGIDNLASHSSDEIFKEDKVQIQLNRIDHNKDGKVEMVQFGNKAVTKEDYDAAVNVAGKGAYKDKTVQDILGLPKDTDLSSGKERTVRIDMLDKYSSGRKTTDTVTIDGKYTYDKNFYEAANEVAGKGDYENKTVNDILGISNDVDLSESEHTYKRYNNSEIGRGKEVELTGKDSSRASAYHISSITKETKIEREKLKQEALKQNNKGD